MISVRCAHCDRTFTFTAKAAGKRVRCKCGSPMRVPEAFFENLRDEPWSPVDTESGSGSGTAVMDPPATRTRTANFSRSAEMRAINLREKVNAQPRRETASPKAAPSQPIESSPAESSPVDAPAAAPAQASPDAPPIVPRPERMAAPCTEAARRASEVAARHREQAAMHRKVRMAIVGTALAVALAGVALAIGWLIG